MVKLNYSKHLINPISPAILGSSRMCKSPTALLDSPSRVNFLKHLRWGITQIWLLWEPSIKTTAAAMAFQSHTFSSKLARTSSYFQRLSARLPKASCTLGLRAQCTAHNIQNVFESHWAIEQETLFQIWGIVTIAKSHPVCRPNLGTDQSLIIWEFWFFGATLLTKDVFLSSTFLLST